MGSPPPVNLNQKNTTSNEAQFLPSKMPLTLKSPKNPCAHITRKSQPKKILPVMRLNFCPQKCLLTLKNSPKSVTNWTFPKSPVSPHISLPTTLNPPYCRQAYRESGSARPAPVPVLGTIGTWYDTKYPVLYQVWSGINTRQGQVYVYLVHVCTWYDVCMMYVW